MKFKKVLFLSILFFALSNLAHAETRLSGVISENQVWNKAGSPYIVEGLVEIAPEANVSIEPGTEVWFLFDSSLYFYGTLNASGSETEPIIFKQHPEDFGGWNMYFDNGIGNEMNFSKISDFNTIGYLGAEGNIRNTQFENAGTITIQNHGFASIEDSKFESNNFENNQTYVELDLASDLYVSNSQFNNSVFNESAIVAHASSSVLIDGAKFNVITGSALFLDGSYGKVTNSEITGGDYGIEIYRDVDEFGGIRFSFLDLSNTTISSILNSALGIYRSSASVDGLFADNIGEGVEFYAFDQKNFLNFHDGSISNASREGVVVYSRISGDVAAIKKNIIKNTREGITFYSSPNSNLSIIGNEILSNREGITLYSAANAKIEAHENSLVGNTIGASRYSDYSAEFFAENNWWGDASGPKNDQVNPSGIGDEIQEYSGGIISFVPWLEAPPANNECCSNILFLPGLEASRLYAEDNGSENRLWEPNTSSDVPELFLNENGESLGNDIYAKEQDVIDEPFGIGVLGNVYKSFIVDLQKWKSEEKIINDFSAVPYDWRLTMNELLSYGNNVDGKIYYSGNNRATSTSYIIQELQRLAGNSKTGKVTIVAHSNGGILTKALLKKLQDSNNPLFNVVDKVIFVGVPQVGTPLAIGALLHGYDQGIPNDWFYSLVSPSTARAFGKNMPGVYPLLPSETYFQNVSTPAVRFEEGENIFKPFDDAKTAYEDITSKSELDRFLKGEEGRMEPNEKDVAPPSLVNPTLIDYSNILHNELDNWAWPETIELHQIAGWGEQTLATIAYRKKYSCLKFIYNGCLEYGTTWTYKPELVIDGDGTVVAPSALALSTSTSNVKRWWVDLNEFNDKNIPNREHKDILEVLSLRELIKNLLTSYTLIPKYILGEQPSSELVSLNNLQFYLHSPLDLIVKDNNGNIVSSSTNQIQNARFKRFGEVQYVSVPSDAFPTATLVGNGSGSFDFEIEETKNGEIVATTTFTSIPTATSTVVKMKFKDGTIENASNLSIDINGDQAEDISLKPKVGKIVMPPDVIAPEAIISFSTTTNSIVISGTDNFDQNPVIETLATSTKISDDANNFLTLVHKIETEKNHANVKFRQMIYSTSTTMTFVADSSIEYQWTVRPKRNGYLLFVSHIRTQNENIIALYNAITNDTRIISIPKNMKEIDIESIPHNLPKNIIQKRKIKGLVIPYLKTEFGKIIINY